MSYLKVWDYVEFMEHKALQDERIWGKKPCFEKKIKIRVKNVNREGIPKVLFHPFHTGFTALLDTVELHYVGQTCFNVITAID